MDNQEYYNDRYYLNEPGTEGTFPNSFDSSEGNEGINHFTYKWTYFGIFIIIYIGMCYRRSNFESGNHIDDRLLENNKGNNVREIIEKIKENKVSPKDIPSGGNTCSICLEDFTEEKENIILDCKHIYHIDCISQWITKEPTCPLCRGETLV